MADRDLRPLPAGSKVGLVQPSEKCQREKPLPDLGEGFPAEARAAIEAGEAALGDLRQNTFHRWYLVGGACFMLRNVALNRSGANAPAGKRYNQVYATLVHLWPELAKLDKSARAHSIWLFSNSQAVESWLATLPRNQRDRWTHPRTIRNHFEKRFPPLMPELSQGHKPRPAKRSRGRSELPLGDRSREDLEALIATLEDLLSDRDREIVDLNSLIEEKDREIQQLREDVAWERAAKKQLETVITPPLARETLKIIPPTKLGQPDYAAWARALWDRASELTALELTWLLDDNGADLDEYERWFPGAGVGLEDRIRTRIRKLEAAVT